MNERPSLPARLALWCGAFAFVAAIVGPLFAHFEIVSPMAGFAILALGLLGAVIALVCGVVDLARGGGASRGAAIGGLIPAVLVLGTVLLGAARGGGAPRINDITTDTENPPQFVQAVRLDENRGRDMSYPGESFAEQQREGYGSIEPLALDLDPSEAFALVYRVAQEMDSWEITLANPGPRQIEAIDTTWLFRFKDDVAIEVRPDGEGGSLVHMRSKSRDGRGDLGANAARIRGFFELVEQEVKAIG